MSYVTTWFRMLLGLVGGALTGAILVTVYFYLIFESRSGGSGGEPPWLILLFPFIYSLAAWSIGLVVVGLPIWLLLHVLEFRQWRWAALLGIAVTFVIACIVAKDSEIVRSLSPFNADGNVDPKTLSKSQLASQKWQDTIFASLVLSVIGAAVASVVWRIAYRSVRWPTTEAPQTSTSDR